MSHESGQLKTSWLPPPTPFTNDMASKFGIIPFKKADGSEDEVDFTFSYFYSTAFERHVADFDQISLRDDGPIAPPDFNNADPAIEATGPVMSREQVIQQFSDVSIAMGSTTKFAVFTELFAETRHLFSIILDSNSGFRYEDMLSTTGCLAQFISLLDHSILRVACDALSCIIQYLSFYVPRNAGYKTLNTVFYDLASNKCTADVVKMMKKISGAKKKETFFDVAIRDAFIYFGHITYTLRSVAVPALVQAGLFDNKLLLELLAKVDALKAQEPISLPAIRDRTNDSGTRLQFARIVDQMATWGYEQLSKMVAEHTSVQEFLKFPIKFESFTDYLPTLKQLVIHSYEDLAGYISLMDASDEDTLKADAHIPFLLTEIKTTTTAALKHILWLFGPQNAIVKEYQTRMKMNVSASNNTKAKKGQNPKKADTAPKINLPNYSTIACINLTKPFAPDGQLRFYKALFSGDNQFTNNAVGLLSQVTSYQYNFSDKQKMVTIAYNCGLGDVFKCYKDPNFLLAAQTLMKTNDDPKRVAFLHESLPLLVGFLADYVPLYEFLKYPQFFDLVGSYLEFRHHIDPALVASSEHVADSLARLLSNTFTEVIMPKPLGQQTKAQSAGLESLGAVQLEVFKLLLVKLSTVNYGFFVTDSLKTGLKEFITNNTYVGADGNVMTNGKAFKLKDLPYGVQTTVKFMKMLVAVVFKCTDFKIPPSGIEDHFGTFEGDGGKALFLWQRDEELRELLVEADQLFKGEFEFILTVFETIEKQNAEAASKKMAEPTRPAMNPIQSLTDAIKQLEEQKQFSQLDQSQFQQMREQNEANRRGKAQQIGQNAPPMSPQQQNEQQNLSGSQSHESGSQQQQPPLPLTLAQTIQQQQSTKTLKPLSLQDQKGIQAQLQTTPQHCFLDSFARQILQQGQQALEQHHQQQASSQQMDQSSQPSQTSQPSQAALRHQMLQHLQAQLYPEQDRQLRQEQFQQRLTQHRQEYLQQQEHEQKQQKQQQPQQKQQQPQQKQQQQQQQGRQSTTQAQPQQSQQQSKQSQPSQSTQNQSQPQAQQNQSQPETQQNQSQQPETQQNQSQQQAQQNQSQQPSQLQPQAPHRQQLQQLQQRPPAPTTLAMRIAAAKASRTGMSPPVIPVGKNPNPIFPYRRPRFAMQASHHQSSRRGEDELD